MAMYQYRALRGGAASWTMDDPVVVRAVDALLGLVKRRTERGGRSLVGDLSVLTDLSRSEVRSLLRLAKDSRRSFALWEGFGLDWDRSNGYRVIDHLDVRLRRRVRGDLVTAEIITGRVSYIRDLGQATDTERLVGALAESRASDLRLVREYWEEHQDGEQPQPA